MIRSSEMRPIRHPLLRKGTRCGNELGTTWNELRETVLHKSRPCISGFGYLSRFGVTEQRLRHGTATMTMGDAGCTRAFSFVAVSIWCAGFSAPTFITLSSQSAPWLRPARELCLRE